ncbi:hypothetical protein OAH05_00570 [bacterium]|mgnify:CR=1 FL=1|jgi:hypothetical protein|nr:hypothetical protein [Planctomicrobium sp.]MDB4439284.1 hypothetical protein [Planctomicrobium sp.]MDB4731806.1 hypothetical protein [bacterium]MDB4802396.1 hypothetical protein [bacterium]
MSPLRNSNQTLDRRYQSPANSGEVLAVPSMTDALVDARMNSQELNQPKLRIGSLGFSNLRIQARSEIISKAVEWTNRVTGQAVACAECSHHAALLFVTGHQPQLAHAGVWAKTFAAAGLAKSSQGLGLNIIVDNDTVGTQAIQVPTGTRENPQYQDVSFDSAQPQQPWEELKIQDRELFESFGERVDTAMAQWGINPLLNEMWSNAIEVSRQTDSMVECLAACRILQERSWGNSNLELPLSEICQTESFIEFLSHILLNSQLFHTSYNEIVSRYRRENGIRNDRHPVPDLQVEEDAFELPFWFWKANDVERGQVFVKQNGAEIQIICKNEVILESNEATLKDDLRELQKFGKLRTRALTTTLFSRLFLADLFIHGIGGAKYDEMTDLLINEFYGIAPPKFLVLSATLHLPIEDFSVTEQEVISLKSKLRDYEFNADRYLTGPEVDPLEVKKQKLIEQHWQAQTANLPKRERVQLRRTNRQRHFDLKRVNEELAALAKNDVEQLETQLELANAKLRANTILKNREFSAVIYPENEVHQLASQLMDQSLKDELENSSTLTT